MTSISAIVSQMTCLSHTNVTGELLCFSTPASSCLQSNLTTNSCSRVTVPRTLCLLRDACFRVLSAIIQQQQTGNSMSRALPRRRHLMAQNFGRIFLIEGGDGIVFLFETLSNRWHTHSVSLDLRQISTSKVVLDV